MDSDEDVLELPYQDHNMVGYDITIILNYTLHPFFFPVVEKCGNEGEGDVSIGNIPNCLFTVQNIM